MFARSGSPVSFPVEFSAGFPAGNVDWKVYDETGSVSSTGSSVVPAGAVSINIAIQGAANTLPQGQYLGYRDVAWTYTTADNAIVSDEVRYVVEARLPYGVSPDGVRGKLGGVDPIDLPDSDVELARAFLIFRDSVTADLLATASGDSALVAIKDAIEATAALNLVPQMQVRIAASETSGTDSYKRQTIDWSMVQDNLADIVTAGILAVNPGYDQTANWGPLFVTATPGVDPITGAGYVADQATS